MKSKARRVSNPYVGHDGYHCFGCDPDNRSGLRLEFFVEGEVLKSTWEPRSELEGYPGVIHGGIQATLADEIGGWHLHAVRGQAGMTKDLQITYHKPARTTDGPFFLEAREIEASRRTVTIEIELRGTSGTVFSTTRCVYVVFSEEVARKRLSFPGKEAFLPPE